MNALGFLFRPASAAVLSTAHVLVLVLAISWAPYAAQERRPLAAVVLLAALAWPVKVAVSVWVATRPVGVAHTAFAWAPLFSRLPLWAAVAVGLAALWRARRTSRGSNAGEPRG